uniref:Macaca fascicularis brain cDNA clone: QtrA-18069, similar to human procollagen (type III) N-endopeptidase (PCOLN3), mRNA, RefSeq: NM_002768.1 n=1 Tax=Macaca fascicularis TaxID=9541 RepID=I7GF01_MACFA|nr:unnamed protein product [Macaca fascicularis]
MWSPPPQSRPSLAAHTEAAAVSWLLRAGTWRPRLWLTAFGVFFFQNLGAQGGAGVGRSWMWFPPASPKSTLALRERPVRRG